MCNFLGRLLVASAILAFGFINYKADIAGNNASKVALRSLLDSNNVTLEANLFNQIYLGVSFILMGAPIILIFRGYSYLLVLAYVIANLSKYITVAAMPRKTMNDAVAIVKVLFTDLTVLGALMLATTPGRNIAVQTKGKK